jgi:hypothetical protein
MPSSRWRRPVANERGATAVIVAISMVMLISIVALAVDLGMVLTARAEAQRVADASAHAGAAEFWFAADAREASPAALRSAVDFAAMNTIRHRAVRTTATTGERWVGNVLRYDFVDGYIEVMPDDWRVRTTLHHRGLPTWFARVFGVNEVDVGAQSAAAVRSAGTATCVKPFAIPDAWDDRNNDGFVGGQPSNHPSTGEYYKRHELHNMPPPSTGFGSAFRNSLDPQVQNDWGRRVRLRAGNQATSPGPSMYFSWALPEDANMPKSCPGGTGGQSTVQLNICSCNMNGITLGRTYETLTGAAMGWVRHGLEDLIKQDPNARWDPVLKTVVGSDPKFGHWTNSPRLITVPLFDPRILLTEGSFKSGKQEIVFNNFTTLFIEPSPGGSGQNDDINGVFLPTAKGMYAAGPGEVAGTLIRVLQIVE